MMTGFKANLNYESYKDKVYACWIGKNIGGTMGAPYEGKQQILDVKGFSTKENVVLPNDDLDLQLVWLLAVEHLGPKAISSSVLGEFWLSYITPYWNEYGIGAANLKRGLTPPLSGDYQNDWKSSNGAWIRTEIWACLAPGCPDLAAKYAIEDAMIDHGTGEGTYAAAFVAAMQAAAFIIKDIRSCIHVGLSKIPENCRMSDSIRTVLDCYDAGMTAVETRNVILERNKDIGNGWFEAPSNVSYAVIGLLFGEGNFKKSMILTINCGDDTDCTAATVGATLGILGGQKAIPEDWKQHIGDRIVTISLNHGIGFKPFPETCTELSERVIAQAPHMLFLNEANVSLVESASDIPADAAEVLMTNAGKPEGICAIQPNSTTVESAFLKAVVCFDGNPEINPLEEKKIRVTLMNTCAVYGNITYNLNLRWWLPDGFCVNGGRNGVTLMHKNRHQTGECTLEFVIKAGENVAAVNRCVLEVTVEGRTVALYIPVILLG